MDLTYRKINISDKAQVKQLGLISYGQFAETLGDHWQTMKKSLGDSEKWNRILRVSNGFACCDKDKMVGMAFLIPNGHPWDVYKAEWCHIRLLGVDPAYEGKGIARTLMGQCIDQARKSGEKTIALHTSEFMDAARHIYESAGFKILQPIEPRFGKKYWLYTLEL
jgi:ribosomal protein S18 acetylase RimI-like enzyme